MQRASPLQADRCLLRGLRGDGLAANHGKPVPKTCDYWATASFRALPAWKTGALEAGI